MRLESEFPSPFSGAKFNCTCSCPDEKRESIIERCRDLCAHSERGFLFSRCQLELVRDMIYREFLMSLTRQIYRSFDERRE